MTQAEMLYQFFSSFGIPAYEENAVPDKATMPYITYRFVSGAFGHTVTTTASIWTKSTSLNIVTTKSKSISEYLQNGGVRFGAMLVRRGSPFSQTMNDPDKAIKRIIMNFDIEFLTE